MSRGYAVTIAEGVIWNGVPVACPECGDQENLTLAAGPDDADIVLTCANDHLSIRDDIPGLFVEKVAQAIEAYPDAPILDIRIGDGS
jgi:uncharacterized protein YbaR (Trm112 family)